MKKELIKWFTDLFSKPYTYEFVDEIPDKPKSKKVYFVKHEEYCWQAIMVCPCGCKKILHLNLIADYLPFWEYKIENRNRVTFSPSIHRIVGCKSHFFIRKGKIIWV